MQDTKLHWSFLHEAMHNMCSPTAVIAAAEEALRATARHWKFAAPTAMEAVMAKVEARLPLIFSDTQLGQVLTTVSPSAADVIWHHMKNSHMQATGSSSHVQETQGKYADMAAANAAWSRHYTQRMVQRCQRRSRLVKDATQGTT